MNPVEQNAVGGLIASEAHGVIALLLRRINDELRLAWGFKEELEDLKKQLATLDELLKGASCHRVTNPLMCNWLKKINDVAEEADDLIDEWSYEAIESRIQTRKRDKLIKGVTYPFNRFVKAHKVRDLKKLISNIYNEALKHGIKPLKVAAGDVYSNEPSHDIQERRLHDRRLCVGDELLLGRDEDIVKLVRLLCDPTNNNSDLNVIGIVGMAGLGKTALSKRVSKVEEVTHLFNSLVIWLVISHKFDLLDILNRIVEILFGKASNMKDKQALLLKLQGKLKGKRYFLILDDVWDTTFWESLLSSLLEIGGSKGTAILVTSRDKNAVEKMETRDFDDCNHKITPKKPFIYSLAGLNEVDSWSLFMARIGDDNLATSGKRLIAKRMIKNCGGVPLAIRALGDLLRDKSVERWKKIGESHLWKTEDESGILPSLKLSFDYLPNTALKKCFSYCAIYEEDEVILKDQLIYMWMANGFLQPYNEMELKGDEYFKILLNNSFFQEAEMDELGNVKTFKMHDLVLSLARDVLAKESLCLKKYDGSSEVRDLSTSCFERKFILTSGKKLRICLINKIVHKLDNLLDCRNLRVLSLIFSWNESMEWGSLGSLKHLRYLYVTLGDPSETRLPEQIDKLYHLQTLWITPVSFATKPTTVSFLPKEIGNLVNLRHIHVDQIAIGIPAGLGHLTALQTLPVITLKQDWGGRLSELGKLNNLRGTLEIQSLDVIYCEKEAQSVLLVDKSKLERLVLKWDKLSERCYQNKILEALQPHKDVAMLEINSYCGTRFPRWLIDTGSPLHNIVSLKLLDCLYAKGNLKLDNFRYLRFLSVIQCINLTISFPIQGFQSCNLLEVLEVDNCYKLENMPDLTPLTELRVLQIVDSYATIKWELVGLGSLPCLTALSTSLLLPEDLCEDSPVCKSLHSLSLGTCRDDDTKTLPVQLQHLVALQNLRISDFRSVETLPDWLGKLTSLRELKLDSMPKLKCLPSLAAMHCLINLKTFRSYECPILSEDLRNQSGEWFKIGHIGEIWDGSFELIPGFSS